MRYLFICTYYFPDTAIAAKRPYFFAKYLSQLGNEVTILCPGNISIMSDDTYKSLNRVRVINYLDNNVQNTTLFDRVLKRFFNKADKLNRFIKGTKYKIKYLKIAIDSLEKEEFDIIFATYGGVENIFGGMYAKKKFKAKWIMDLRDLICQYDSKGIIENLYLYKWEKRALTLSDAVVTVSNGLLENYRIKYLNDYYLIRNGYDSDYNYPDIKEHSDKLNIVYTGKIYGKNIDSLKILSKAINNLVTKGILTKEDIKIHYAGDSINKFRELISDDYLVYHGILGKKDVYKLQKNADIFLVLSWNTKHESTVIPGKFYEAIPLDVPILAIVSGECGNGELMMLNKEYKFGYCYEEVSNDITKLENYLYTIYKDRPMFKQSEKIKEAFNYRTLTGKLLELSQELTRK